MTKKKKNLAHQKAVHRKNNAIQEMAKLGLKLEEETVLLGFVFNHLSVSHLNYLGLTSINKICRAYAGLDICVFCQQISQPCVSMLCPTFKMNDLIMWKNYPLISTSIGTTIAALASNAPVIYHYAFDPEFIDKPHKESNEIIPAFCDKRVKIIVRHKSHKDLIEEQFGIKVCDTIIEDCDVEKLAKFILTEMKHGYKD